MFSSESKNENTGIEIARAAAEFVKYVLPFGADNRWEFGGDHFKRNFDASPDEIHSVHVKLNKELRSTKRPASAIENILFLAQMAMKYGAGNCELQSAVASLFLLAQGISNITNITVEAHINPRGTIKKREAHVFLEFKIPGSNEITVVDPWDDNEVYTYAENARDHKHTGVRQGLNKPPKIISLSEIPIDFNKCKKLLKDCIFQTKILNGDEKYIALKLMRIPLLEVLDDYKEQRQSEINLGLFGVPGKIKINCCEKVISFLKGEDNVHFTKEEYSALTSGRLGGIVSVYADQLPENFFLDPQNENGKLLTRKP